MSLLKEKVLPEKTILRRLRRLSRAYRGHIRRDGFPPAFDWTNLTNKDYVLVDTKNPQLFKAKLVFAAVIGAFEGLTMPIKNRVQPTPTRTSP